jgi:hypothetical protein
MTALEKLANLQAKSKLKAQRVTSSQAMDINTLIPIQEAK